MNYFTHYDYENKTLFTLLCIVLLFYIHLLFIELLGQLITKIVQRGKESRGKAVVGDTEVFGHAFEGLLVILRRCHQAITEEWTVNRRDSKHEFDSEHGLGSDSEHTGGGHIMDNNSITASLFLLQMALSSVCNKHNTKSIKSLEQNEKSKINLKREHSFLHDTLSRIDKMHASSEGQGHGVSIYPQQRKNFLSPVALK